MMTLMIQLKSSVLTFENWTSFSIITKKMAMAIKCLEILSVCVYDRNMSIGFFPTTYLIYKKSGCNSFLTNTFL